MDGDDFDDADLVALTSATEQRPPPPAAKPSSLANAPATTSSPSSAATRPKVVQPTPQALPTRHTASAVLVSPRQRGNPLLTHFHSLPWEYTDTPADYVIGATTCALFLSLKYHRLHPEYIYTRMRALGKLYDLRILLALVDIDNHEEPLRELAKTALVNDYTLILAWSAREAARYLEAYRSMERASHAAIRGQQSTTYADRMVEFVTVPRGVNKADAVGVVSAFGSVRAAVNAHPEELAAVQGWGEVKVKRWAAAVREPFRTERASRKDGGVAKGTFSSVGLARAGTISRQGTLGEGQSPTGEGEGGGGGSERTGAGQQARAWEPGEDEENALVAAAEQDVLVVAPPEDAAAADPPVSKRPRYKEPELGDGIAAALAKYRNA